MCYRHDWITRERERSGRVEENVSILKYSSRNPLTLEIEGLWDEVVMADLSSYYSILNNTALTSHRFARRSYPGKASGGMR